jgi:hypothetical protein
LEASALRSEDSASRLNEIGSFVTAQRITLPARLLSLIVRERITMEEWRWMKDTPQRAEFTEEKKC